MSNVAHEPPDVLTSDQKLELYAFGTTLGIRGLDTEQPDDLAAIESRAHSFASQLRGPNYEPNVHHHDALKDAQYKHDLQELGQRLTPAAEFAAARVVAIEQEVSRHDHGRTKPDLHPWIAPTAVAVLTLTVAPTLHDQFFVSLNDEILAWLASMVFGAMVGTFIAWSLLGSADVTTDRTPSNWLGLLSGIGIGVGLGILRVAHTTSTADRTFAVALTLAEVSVVVALEFIASALRRRYQLWLDQESEVAPHRAELHVAKQAQERCEAARRQGEERCRAHLAYVELRHIRHFHGDDIYKAAKGLIERAYREQLAKNWEIRTGANPGHLRRVI